MASEVFEIRPDPEEISHRLSELADRDAERTLTDSEDMRERLKLIAENFGNVLPLRGKFFDFSFEGVAWQRRAALEKTDDLPADRYVVGSIDGAETPEPLVTLTPELNPTGITYSALVRFLRGAQDSEISSVSGQIHPTPLPPDMPEPEE